MAYMRELGTLMFHVEHSPKGSLPGLSFAQGWYAGGHGGAWSSAYAGVRYARRDYAGFWDRLIAVWIIAWKIKDTGLERGCGTKDFEEIRHVD